MAFRNNEQNLTWISNFLWGIADDVLRDVYVRGKYRDVILPMVVLHRLDTVLAPTKAAVLEMHAHLDQMGVTEQEAALRKAAGFPFYNTSKFSLKDLRNRANQQQLADDFVDWLDGFSVNVQDILENFEFRRQVPRLSKADALGGLIEKFLDPDLRLAGLDNHAMGTVFEDLVRRFNEANNEEAGEHWTPRDVVRLMANLVFKPIEDKIESGTYLLYDPTIGTGGMLTVAEQTLRDLAGTTDKQVSTHLYGQEINPETYAICKADLLLSGEGEEADNVFGGAEYSTLSNDAFRGRTFDFMLANPPYGKSWKTDLEKMGGKAGITDPRFVVNHAGDPEFSLVTRSSDGQMMFLANLVSKMKEDTPLGSRIAEIHSGSSLFTGDAGQGESNIRRWIIERDLVEAIIQLPERMFYNTGIATYVWVLANRKAPHRRGKIQLIDASKWFTPRQRNLGQKGCDLSPDDIANILEAFLAFAGTAESRIFDNEAFGYRKVKVERPLRLRSQCSPELVAKLLYASGDEALRRELHDLYGDDLFENFAAVKTKVEQHLDAAGEEGEDEDAPPPISATVRKRLLDEKRWARDRRLFRLATRLAEELGESEFADHNDFASEVSRLLKSWSEKLSVGDRKTLLRGLSWVDPEAPPVVKKVVKNGSAEPIFGRFAVEIDGAPAVVEYEPDTDLADFEQVPLQEQGGVRTFVEREVLPYAPDAWVDEKSEKVGYEISFTKVFYSPVKLRPLVEIEDDIERLMVESDGLVLAALGRRK